MRNPFFCTVFTFTKRGAGGKIKEYPEVYKVKISTKGRYALRIMIDLSLQDRNVYIPLRDVAQRQQIPLKYMEQIIPFLNRAGYLKSVRGNGGGYKLACSPAECTAGDILRAVEGSLAPIACLEDDPNQCPRREICKTLPFWQGLYRTITDYVDGVTLAHLAGMPDSPAVKS